jgi:hypothetical protein
MSYISLIFAHAPSGFGYSRDRSRFDPTGVTLQRDEPQDKLPELQARTYIRFYPLHRDIGFAAHFGRECERVQRGVS